ncbi:MAG: exodeoxyribonuclease VII large subunit [Chloroflexi bacterium]|nr:exodeoxyribonuclease VII large subunit [Chloroflexota bacterium]
MSQQAFFSAEFATLSVSDVNRQIRNLLESDPILEDISVNGEISNLSVPSSGHIYFTLKDEQSMLKCVLWRTYAAEFRDLLENGRSVIAHGRIGVYERGGSYQLYADALYPFGRGKMYEDFLRLKEKLEQEGLFAEERKRPLPQYPQKVGIVTSLSGAAVQDMLNTLEKRWPNAEVLLSAASVQGVEAPPSIVKALNALISHQPDVILIGRGGGSIEDLWAFNDEKVVRAVAASPIPIISGVGHEIDFTLTDFAADYRAPTPTAAAVTAVPDRYNQAQLLDTFSLRLDRLMLHRYESERMQLNALAQKLESAAPTRQLERGRQTLIQQHARINQAMERFYERQQLVLQNLEQRMNALNPSAVLERGYALIRQADGSLIPSVSQLSVGETVVLQLRDGSAQAEINQIG